MPGAHVHVFPGAQREFVGHVKPAHGVVKSDAPHVADTHHQSGSVQDAPEHGEPPHALLT